MKLATDRRVTAPPAAPVRSRRPILTGLVAGVLGIGCYVYPVAIALLGLATASEAVALGKRLYGQWGWAFKLSGAALAIAAVAVQRRRARSCGLGTQPALVRTAAWIVAVAVGTYTLLYFATKALGALA